MLGHVQRMPVHPQKALVENRMAVAHLAIDLAIPYCAVSRYGSPLG